MKTIKATKQQIEALDFQMLPEDGGQIVERTYATDENGLWHRVHDRSDRSVSYKFATYPARATEEQLRFEPQNGRLPRHNSWRDVVVIA